jgi:CHAT domain
MNDSSKPVDNSPSLAEGTIEAKTPAKASPTIHVHVICGGIEDEGNYAPPNEGWPAVDAIAVGHYLNVEPQFAELALDNAISGRPPSRVPADDGSASATILTDFTRRGIIQGNLGMPFFLPDPRDNKRIIAIAGMGSVGYFASPELTVLVLQLFWALARLGRQHLASVLIGSGTGSLATEDAVARWMQGVARALANGSTLTPVQYLTFIEHNAGKAEEIRDALMRYKSPADGPGLSVIVSPTGLIPPPPGSSSGTICTRQNAPQSVTRIAVEQRGKKYFFGALSNQASHPQDYTTLRPGTISDANDELAAIATPDHQREAGKILFKLLVPQSFWGEFQRRDPIVVECDSRTAWLHWEMMVIPNLERGLGGDGSEFLGIHPTITRQFRNSFAQLPERPPRFDRTLRVLIVADTAEKMPLPASREEAQAIQEIFERYGEFLRSSGSDRRVSVVPLVGPGIANYDCVLEHLFQDQPYDIVHFTGHCDYVKADPASSGWLFSKGKKISAYELARVDRVPEFVFSNGCSTGVTPPNVSLVSRRAVPSFAEAFFQRGVKNFICTAWPIANNPARDFACAFYKTMLSEEPGRRRFMYEAMREARQSIRGTPSGARTWGAYQHYGNPWHRVG